MNEMIPFSSSETQIKSATRAAHPSDNHGLKFVLFTFKHCLAETAHRAVAEKVTNA